MKFKAYKLAVLPLALFCACGHAEDNVVIYGVMDAFAGQLKNTGGTAAQGSAAVLNSGGLTTSYIGFRGVEDLGGGMKAVFALESFVRVDIGATGRTDADPLWGRVANVGLETPAGRITLGRHVSPYSLAATLTAPTALAGGTTVSPIFAQIYRGNLQGGTRSDNSIRYASPNLGGLTAVVVGSLGQEIASGPNRKRDRSTDTSVRYANGPLTAVAAAKYINLVNNNDGHEQTAYMVGGIYDLRVVKLNAQIHRTDESFTNSALDIKQKTYEIGVSVPVGAGEFMGSLAKTDLDHQRGAALSTKRDGWVVGYDYALSKRTDIYAAFFRDRLKNPEILQQITAVGVRHLF